MNRIILPVILFSLIAGGCDVNKGTPFLSNLHVDKNTPLYTTYAAAMERSEFVLDEGYEFRFYKPDSGIDFATDTGGDICVGFFIDGKWVYLEKDLFKSPVISMSYPDLVQYHYYPVEGLRVEASFLVQSSHTALLDMKLVNEGAEDLDFSVVPFLRNEYRSFYNINGIDSSGVIFSHEEYPDEWTRSHELPFEDTIKNIVLLSQKSAIGKFNSINGETPVLPFQVNLSDSSTFQVNGRALKDGVRLSDQPPLARFQLHLKNDPETLLTENSPLIGIVQPSIDHQGFYRVELGNFAHVESGDTYVLNYYTENGHLNGRVEGEIDKIPGAIRQDLELAPYHLPEIPQNVQININDRTAELSWEASASVFHIYRRDYPQPLYHEIGMVKDVHSFIDKNIDSGKIYGYIIVAEVDQKRSIHSREVRNIPLADFGKFTKDALPLAKDIEQGKIISLQTDIRLGAGQQHELRLVRKVANSTTGDLKLFDEARSMLKEPIDSYITHNEALFNQVPEMEFDDRNKELLYWSSFNMMRQVFFPPEEKSSYNYYVFSREPTWGWGHGGQVFHESISMLSYAYLDPVSAMNSQRVYSERQYDNGYINYRTGSYLDEIIEYNHQLTSSAPWYAWENWEVYKITRDKKFLKEMYQSSKAFYHFFVSNRDSDGDGLCEWGGHAVLESVRDALVAVWDEVGWPSNFEGVDVNSMLVMEAKSLESMALELGLQDEAAEWRADHQKRAELINKTFWDEKDGFYYNVDKDDHDFTFENPNDLKRQEIIGFLPMWAGVASEEQAKKLVEVLLNKEKFWRPYGIPSLAADDSYYNHKGYWNGPVWVEWNFFIVQALLKYGYDKEARELVDKVSAGMIEQLKTNHNLWEFYSPDEAWGGYHKTYIWAGIINRMMLDVNKKG